MREIKYTTVEEFLMDDSFLAWLHQTDEKAIRQWMKWIETNPENKRLADEAVQLISIIGWAEKEFPVSEKQINAGYERLINTIAQRLRVNDC
jgi:hypothetical protein